MSFSSRLCGVTSEELSALTPAFGVVTKGMETSEHCKAEKHRITIEESQKSVAGKINQQLLFPRMWKAKNSVSFYFHGCGRLNHTLAFTAIAVDAKLTVSFHLPQLWETKLVDRFAFHFHGALSKRSAFATTSVET